MTFEDLRQAVYALTGYATSPPAVVVTRTGLWLNEAQRRILRQPAMTDLRQGTLGFSSVANQTTYAIPQLFERIDAIVQQTNDRKLRFLSRQAYRLMDPGERASGTPDSYVPEGLTPVFRQPKQTDAVAGTGVWAVSSAAGDVTQTLNLQGIDANGDIRAPASAVLNGTTRIQLASTISFLEVISWNVSATCVGTISLYDAVTAGNVLARITPGFKSVQYELIRLWPTPAAVLPYQVDGQMLIQDMVQATDVPMLPPSYHDVLTDYARMKEYERTGDARLTVAAQQYTDGVNKLRNYVQFPPDYRPVAGSLDNSVRRNNLGSWYGADWSWP